MSSKTEASHPTCITASLPDSGASIDASYTSSLPSASSATTHHCQECHHHHHHHHHHHQFQYSHHHGMPNENLVHLIDTILEPPKADPFVQLVKHHTHPAGGKHIFFGSSINT
eukprot:616316-Pelagomonas_calceolata.AAC.2